MTIPDAGEWVSLIQPGDVVSLPERNGRWTVIENIWLPDTGATRLVLDGVEDPVDVPPATWKLPIHNRLPTPPVAFGLDDQPEVAGAAPARLGAGRRNGQAEQLTLLDPWETFVALAAGDDGASVAAV